MLIVSRRRYRIASSSVSNSGHGCGGSPGNAGPRNCRAHGLFASSVSPFMSHFHSKSRRRSRRHLVNIKTSLATCLTNLLTLTHLYIDYPSDVVENTQFPGGTGECVRNTLQDEDAWTGFELPATAGAAETHEALVDDDVAGITCER